MAPAGAEVLVVRLEAVQEDNESLEHADQVFSVIRTDPNLRGLLDHDCQDLIYEILCSLPAKLDQLR